MTVEKIYNIIKVAKNLDGDSSFIGSFPESSGWWKPDISSIKSKLTPEW